MENDKRVEGETVEIWKDVKGYERKYQVSNFGRVKALAKTVLRKHKYSALIPERIFINTINKRGYPQVGLWKDKIYKRFNVHRLVAIAFIPIDSDRNWVNHIDGSRSNNHVSNLEWVTPSENNFHGARLHKITGSAFRARGQTHFSTRFKDADIAYIRINPDSLSGKELASKFNVWPSCISRIKNNVSWKHIEAKQYEQEKKYA